LSDLGVFGGGLGISVADLRAGGQVFPGVARRAVQTGAVRSVALRCDPNEGWGAARQPPCIRMDDEFDESSSRLDPLKFDDEKSI
jgi:hypothetical protein